MIRYVEPVIRPPAEADALILQATIGCSHNRCAFCPTYRAKSFKKRPEAELMAEIQFAADHLPGIRKVFLGDGDALALSTDYLKKILDTLYASLPDLKKTAVYASPGNFVHKSVADLRDLRQRGLSLVYTGFESGDDEVLRRIDKGFTADEIASLCGKAREADLKMSATVILGLGGPSRSLRHAENTARLIDRITPRFISALTLMLPLGEDDYRGRFGDPNWRPLTPTETLIELRHLIHHIHETGMIFRSNHASNYLPLAGRFAIGKPRMLAEIDAALKNTRLLRPECLRDL